MQTKNSNHFQTPYDVLKKVYGYIEFRDGQLEIIKNILAKKDCLAILPTGAGKSICFQIPGIMFSGITIVVSPLISLMKDQVDTLKSKGITACYISSLLTLTELKNTYDLLKLNRYKFVYIAPERFHSKKFTNIIKKIPVSLLVIDEAHCISSWGNDFRPEFKKIKNYYKYLSENCIKVAFTATANKKVQKEIITSLQLKNPFVFYQSFERKNLFLEVIHCYSQTIKNLVLLRLLKKHKNQTGIIYCSTRKATRQLAEYLKNLEMNTLHYHGGLTKEEKNTVQTAFLTGHTKIIVATNAFGMGIDKSNIRFVVHYQIPGNIENYYQEVGRAGRDRKESWCYLLFCKKDLIIQNHLLKKYPKKIEKLKSIYNFVNKNQCRTQFILNYFNEKSLKCKKCDVCESQKNPYFYPKCELLLKASEEEIMTIKKLIIMKKELDVIQKNFPLTNTLIAFLSLLKPKNKKEYLQISGIGIGIYSVWEPYIRKTLA